MHNIQDKEVFRNSKIKLYQTVSLNLILTLVFLHMIQQKSFAATFQLCQKDPNLKLSYLHIYNLLKTQDIRK